MVFTIILRRQKLSTQRSRDANHLTLRYLPVAKRGHAIRRDEYPLSIASSTDPKRH
jgi:hypothetical protein